MARNAYTDDQARFFGEFAYGHSYQEIANKYNEKFGSEITAGRVKSYLGNHNITTGRTGRFEKGHVPANKGSGKCSPRCRKTWFRKGDMPKNHKSVGTESVRKDTHGRSYIWIKVAEPNNWKMKHVYVWERHNGPVPKGRVVIFLDGNYLNTDIGNLAAIDRGTHAILNSCGLRTECSEYTAAAVKVAELIHKISEAKRRN